MDEERAVEEQPIEVKDNRRFEESGDLKPEAKKKKYEVKPRKLWVLIRQMTEEEARTEAGVVMPGEDFFLMDKGKPKSQRGIIVALSQEITDLQVGDYVIFTNFPIDLEDIEELTGSKDLKLVRDEEVYASVRECE